MAEAALEAVALCHVLDSRENLKVRGNVQSADQSALERDDMIDVPASSVGILGSAFVIDPLDSTLVRPCWRSVQLGSSPFPARRQALGMVLRAKCRVLIVETGSWIRNLREGGASATNRIPVILLALSAGFQRSFPTRENTGALTYYCDGFKHATIDRKYGT